MLHVWTRFPCFTASSSIVWKILLTKKLDNRESESLRVAGSRRMMSVGYHPFTLSDSLICTAAIAVSTARFLSSSVRDQYLFGHTELPSTRLLNKPGLLTLVLQESIGT